MHNAFLNNYYGVENLVEIEFCASSRPSIASLGTFLKAEVNMKAVFWLGITF